MHLTGNIELTDAQARAMARGLYAIAAVDGIHPNETALIEAFFEDAGGADKKLSPISAAELAAALTDPEHRLLFVKTALLVAHVHKKVTEVEETLLEQFARALEVSDLEMLALEFSLVRQLSREASA